MAQALTAFQRLVRYWQSSGCALTPGASDQALADFEHRYKVRLPADLREYFTLCNGLPMCAGAGWHWDLLDLLAFWRLEDVAPLQPDDGLPSRLAAPTSYFMFAGFLIDSHVVAIHLTATPDAPCPVIVYAGEHAVFKVGESFSDFVAVYFDAPERIVAPR